MFGGFRLLKMEIFLNLVQVCDFFIHQLDILSDTAANFMVLRVPFEDLAMTMD